MGAIQYIAEALSEPSLCLPAANALRSLCDANRMALAPHLHAFGALHANLANIPVSIEFTFLPPRRLANTGYRTIQSSAVHLERYSSPATN